MRAVIHLSWIQLFLLGSAFIAAPAEARIEHLRWLQADYEVRGITSYRVYLRVPGGL